jgi:FkbM family methyltransferase
MSTHPWFLDARNYPRIADAGIRSGHSPWFHRVYARYARTPNHPCKLRILSLMETIFGLQEVVAPTACGLMQLDSKDYLQRAILLQGIFEKSTLERMRELLQPGATFFDVGANIGQHALWGAQCVGAAGRVVAVEPNPDICHRLLVNRRLNGFTERISVAAVALSARPEVLTFEAPPFWNLGLSRQVSEGEEFLGLERILVASTTLDELCRHLDIRKIDLLKIDTEGSELGVLQGFLSSDVVACPNIIFEYMPQDFSYGTKPEDYLDFLRSKGYQIFEIDGRPFEGGRPAIDDNLWARKQRD